jgi:hypothetical protein
VVDREKFARHLASASEQVREFATRFVVNELPTRYRYLIEVGLHANDFTRPDGTSFPVMHETVGITTTTHLGPLDAASVLDFLWREGAVPRWIDMNVRMADEAYTYLGLICAGDFHVDKDHLWYGPSFPPHFSHETPPFQICGPFLPLRWTQRGENEKFDLRWRYEQSS